MFRKITSNREPGRTLGSELNKEFGTYIDRAAGYGRKLLNLYPRQVFAVMIFSMLGSGILAFTVMRSHEKPEIISIKSPSQSTADGLNQIIGTAGALQTLWGLQQQVDSLLKTSSLKHTDSLTLNIALAQMDSLQHAIRKIRSLQEPSKTITP